MSYNKNGKSRQYASKPRSQDSSIEKEESNTKYSSSKSKGKRGRYNSSSNSDDSTSRDRIRPSAHKGAMDNDIAWYSKSPATLAAAASFPYGSPVGSPIDYSTAGFPHADLPAYDKYVPGILTAHVLLGPGVGTSENTPMNIAARNIYSFVRHANSGHSNYDSPDLMMYLLAVDELLAFYYFGKRAYGAMQLYNTQNRYFPAANLAALGFNFDDLAENYAQMHYALNLFASKIASLAAPNVMPLYARHEWMFSHIYLDGVTPKAQAYAFVPEGYRVFTGYTDTGSALAFHSIRNFVTKLPETMTVDKWKIAMNSMIEPLLKSEDIGIMSGDILKAYGSSGLVTMESVPIDYAVVPEYNEEVLSQFCNAIAVGIPDDQGNRNITQDPNVGAGQIKYAPTFKPHAVLPELMNSMLAAKLMINTSLAAPTVADTTIMTRLMPAVYYDHGSDEVVVLTCGSEICTEFSLYSFYKNLDASITLKRFGLTTEEALVLQTGASVSDCFNVVRTVMSKIDWMSKFAFHPRVWLNTFDSVSHIQVPYLLWELDNYALVDRFDLEAVHEACLLSEFDVPASFSAQKY